MATYNGFLFRKYEYAMNLSEGFIMCAHRMHHGPIYIYTE